MTKIKSAIALLTFLSITFSLTLNPAMATKKIQGSVVSPIGGSIGLGGSSGSRSSAGLSTSFEVYNPSQPDVTVWVVLPTRSNLGCGPTRLSQLQAVDLNNKNPYKITQFADNAQLGSFKLPRGRGALIEPICGTSCLDGLNVTFLNHPQCPCTGTCAGDQPFVPGPNLPNGTNFVEATLNAPGSGQETVDISCVNGANTQVAVEFQGGPAWNAGPGGSNITRIENSWVNVNCPANNSSCDNNCDRVGVFPYNATLCEVAGPGACPSAASVPFCLSRIAQCNVQRAKQNGGFGGLVKATYIGPIAPPN